MDDAQLRRERVIEQDLRNIRERNFFGTAVIIDGLSDHADYRRYGDALQENSVVESLNLNLPTVSAANNNEDYDSILSWIETSRRLKRTKLCCGSPPLVARFLRAISLNTRIHHLTLTLSQMVLSDPEAWASLLRTTTTLQLNLTLESVGFGAANQELIQNALKDSRCLQSLHIKGDSHAMVYNLLLPALSGSASISEVKLEQSSETTPSQRDHSIAAIERFLEDPPRNLQNVWFCRFTIQDDARFAAMLLQLAQSESITAVSFENCDCFGGESKIALTNMFQLNQGIRKLALRVDNLGAFSMPVDFLESNTSLKEVDVDFELFGEGTRSICRSLVKALEVNTTVECLKIHALDGPMFESLVESIPKFTAVKELSFLPIDHFDEPFSATQPGISRKAALLQALEPNSSLTNIVIFHCPNLTLQYLKHMSFYMKRNKHGPAMLAAPTDRTPLSLRPRLFAAIQKSSRGPTEIFHDLLQQRDNVGTAGGRKRGRPDDDDEPNQVGLNPVSRQGESGVQRRGQEQALPPCRDAFCHCPTCAYNRRGPMMVFDEEISTKHYKDLTQEDLELAELYLVVRMRQRADAAWQPYVVYWQERVAQLQQDRSQSTLLEVYKALLRKQRAPFWMQQVINWEQQVVLFLKEKILRSGEIDSRYDMVSDLVPCPRKMISF